MSAGTEQELARALAFAKGARDNLAVAERQARRDTMNFIRVARRCHWSWAQIGRPLGVTGTAVQRLYERNSKKVNA